MQGKLQEIDIRSILQLIELGQRTGVLFVEASTAQYWYIFCANGGVIYASEREGSLARLRDYLRRFNAEASLDEVQIPPKSATNTPEYTRLWALLEHHKVTPDHSRQILIGMLREVLFDVCSLVQGSFIFEAGAPLSPQLAVFPMSPLLKETVGNLQEWKRFYPHIISPAQIPTIINPAALQKNLPPQVYKAFSVWADGKTSLQQMSRYLGRDVLTVAKALYPYVQGGTVQLSDAPVVGDPPPSVPHGQVPHVVCIDDSMAIQKSVEYYLQSAGYQVTTIGNPLQALSRVFTLKPDMILCDVAMPKLDGYELCSMLRKTAQFRSIPIVMLTGKDGFTERIKARMAGANEFLGKPFQEEELITIVEANVGKPPAKAAE